MRAKLLRALAHLKAARRHLAECRKCIYDATGTADALTPTEAALGTTIHSVSIQYANSVFAALDPAELSR